MEAILRHDETTPSASFDIENTFVGVQMNIEMTKFEKNRSQMVNMKVQLLRMSRKVIEIGFHNVFDIMKILRHGPLKCSANIFHGKS